MKWVVVYVAVANGPETTDYCASFAASWLAFPPGVECRLVVACNGGPLKPEQSSLLLPLEPFFFPRQNDQGYDITAYQDCASKFDCDAMCCCGQSIHFHRAGWLGRYQQSWEAYGPGMYGTFSSNLVRQHLNTTGFVIEPNILKAWPRPQNKEDRYNFEHGERSIWKMVNAFGHPTRMVTWDGSYAPQHWRYPKNIMWRGDQSNCLMFCSHTDRWFAADEQTKIRWSKGADLGGSQL